MALQKKPPVVTIMGHVDHGKTTLLDFIRKTKLAAKEVGEITQTIGAYQIEFEDRKITFIDTPGHEVFREMRSRGARVADLVVLVVAANDGVMPQTKESIKIIQEAGVPFLVAINKIDLPDAMMEKIKTQLSEVEVFVEGYGGKIVALPISAKTGEGVDQLLEMILLTTDMEDLKADPEGNFEAFVIESKADKLCGSVVNLVIKNGSLKKGDEIDVDYDGVSYKYKVETMFEVHPTDIQVLDQDDTDSFLTLVTCVPPGDPGKPKRLIVRARVIPPDQVSYANTNNKSYENSGN